MSDPYGNWEPDPLTETSVWHYTSAEGLVGILSNRELWAGEVTAMNDLREISEGFTYIGEWLDANGTPVARQVRKFLTHDTRKWARRVFVVCACLDGDDAGQWRLYGGLRAGYAIELDTTADLQVISRAADEPGVPQPVTNAFQARHRRIAGSRRRYGLDRRARAGAISVAFRTFGQVATVSPWLKVAYSQAERDDLLDDLLRWARRRFDEYDAARADPAVDRDDLDILRQQIREMVDEALCKAAALIKSPGFSGEREARKIIDVGVVDSHVEYRATELGPVRYVRLSQVAGARPDVVARPDLGHQTLPIERIVLRRTPAVKRQKPVVKALMRRAGLPHAKTRISKVTLRL